MKTLITKIILTLCGLAQITGCDREPEEILAVRIVFDSNIGNVSIFETMQNDPLVHLDTVIYEFLPSKTNSYQFQLEFKKDDSNGDYLIVAHSCEKSILISEVDVNNDFTFSYLYDGERKTEKDKIYVTLDMICN